MTFNIETVFNQMVRRAERARSLFANQGKDYDFDPHKLPFEVRVVKNHDTGEIECFAYVNHSLPSGATYHDHLTIAPASVLMKVGT